MRNLSRYEQSLIEQLLLLRGLCLLYELILMMLVMICHTLIRMKSCQYLMVIPL